AESLVRVWLQRAQRAGGGGRVLSFLRISLEPDGRGGRHEFQLRLGDLERAPAAQNFSGINLCRSIISSTATTCFIAPSGAARARCRCSASNCCGLLRKAVPLAASGTGSPWCSTAPQMCGAPCVRGRYTLFFRKEK